MSFSKLHSSIVNSSLWCEPDHVRILFITLLAMADKDGCVYGSRGGLERLAMLDSKACKEVDPWVVLMSPDKDSSDKIRAPENEGRRIEEISGGFRLLNFEYYRGIRNDDDRREQNRRAQAKFREKQVSLGKPRKASVSRCKPQKAQTEADTDTDTDTKEECKINTRATVVANKSSIAKPEGVEQQAWQDWIAVRKAKRAGPVTKTALARVVHQADAAGISLSDAIVMAAARGWVSFEAEWVRGKQVVNGKRLQTFEEMGL